MLLTKIGRWIALIAQVLDSPRAITLLRRGVSTEFVELNHPWITNAGINTVFDIGAGTGRFAAIISDLLPTAMVYSFEPIQESYEKLRKRTAELGRVKAFNIALGDTEGDIEFRRNEYSPSSSMLPMAELHKQIYPFTDREHLTKVRSAKLDDIATDLMIQHKLLIKIDVQGYEDKVIAGGRSIIGEATILIVETSFQSLYVGQPLFEDIYELLKEDFRYVGALDQSRSPIDGSILQEDSVFLRRSI